MLTISRIECSTTQGKIVLCKCDCGNVIAARLNSLKNGHTKSCGCFRVTNATKHGMYKKPEYESWIGMIQRCTNSNNQAYKDYGGRGIKVCESWLTSFENFYKDMGKRPDGKTLDRKDVNGDYEPNNCHWATNLEQANNKRNTILITYRNITKPLKQWCKELNINYNTVWDRLNKGLDIHDAFSSNRCGGDTANGGTLYSENLY